ncbi:unnamed protein product [Fraxinus pennsylvanica]|uniref:Uncharacterized protein n=1 Tax=Fraxinus pennsylvanica TaxID=56036 RepID=A0AAD2DMZ7_9LAMI|nr:unnamed protein product [Fraxinus pennsylvanica]
MGLWSNDVSSVVNVLCDSMWSWMQKEKLHSKGQVYDPITNNLADMATGLREGWTGSWHLFVVTEHERTNLKIYDTETYSWYSVEGHPVPKQICKPFSVD